MEAANTLHTVETDEKLKNLIQNSDRLSSLHDSIIYHIFSFIPTKDAVKTSILSKRWHKLWLSLAYVDLEEVRMSHKESFMNFVDHFLLHHDESSIMKFRLKCWYASDYSHINSWVRAAVKAGVQEFDIYTRQIEMRTLPSLFDCKSLVTLKLHIGNSILLQFPELFCFPKMKTIHLKGIILPGSFSFQLSNSPDLESLLLDLCLLGPISSLSSPKLQDQIADDQSSGNFCNLNDVYIGLYCPLSSSNCLSTGFITKIYNVKTLHLSFTFISNLNRVSYLLDHLPTFCNLKHLGLTIGTMVAEVGFMAGLIRRCPTLQSLHIEFSNLYWKLGTELKQEDELKPEEFPSLHVPGSLKWIRMDCFQGSKNQKQLVRLFLGSAQFLEKFIIEVKKYGLNHPRHKAFLGRDENVVVDKDFIYPNALCQELLQFPRLSTSCVFEVL